MAAAGAYMLGSASAGSSADRTAPDLSVRRFDVPDGACDTHVHVLDPTRFPYQPKRQYTPGPAPVAALRAMHRRIGIARTVVVQNSVYGTDSRCLLDALRQLGENARGVTTIGPASTDADIEALDAAGVRGARINLAVVNNDDPDAIARSLRIESRLPAHWHLHINAELSAIASAADRLARLRRPPVLDHFAHASAAAGKTQPGFAVLTELLAAGNIIVKLSAPYQISSTRDYADVDMIARALIEANPNRIMWGSDWPHTGGVNRSADQPLGVVEPFRREDDVYNLSLLWRWTDNVGRRSILIDTPSSVYGFPPDLGQGSSSTARR